MWVQVRVRVRVQVRELSRTRAGVAAHDPRHGRDQEQLTGDRLGDGDPLHSGARRHDVAVAGGREGGEREEQLARERVDDRRAEGRRDGQKCDEVVDQGEEHAHQGVRRDRGEQSLGVQAPAPHLVSDDRDRRDEEGEHRRGGQRDVEGVSLEVEHRHHDRGDACRREHDPGDALHPSMRLGHSKHDGDGDQLQHERRWARVGRPLSGAQHIGEHEECEHEPVPGRPADHLSRDV